MRFGIIGAGRIGGNLALQALDAGHEVVCYTLDRARLDELAAEGVEAAGGLADAAARLAPPRLLLLYLPQGRPVDDTVTALLGLLDPGDIVVDGGNSHWDDSRRRHDQLATRGVHYLGMGTSGGLVELMAALRERPDALGELSTCVEDTGEVKWVEAWAVEHDVPAPVVALSQHLLMAYRDEHREPATPMAKAVALMRHGFGGHPLHPRDDA